MRCRPRASSTVVAIRVVVGLAVALAAAWPPGHAFAQAGGRAQGESREQYADQLYAAGMVAYDNGNYRQALDYFQQSHDLSGRADILYDVGLAADRQGLGEAALRAFVLYLEKVPDAENRVEVEQRVAALKQLVENKQAERREASAADRRAVEASVLSPEEVARGAEIKGSATAPADYSDDGAVDDDNLLTKWWLWTGVGVVVTASIVTVIAVSGGSETRTRDTFTGTNGKVVMTLGSAPR
jgi:tetratricopeptide (TPR) repeat protein